MSASNQFASSLIAAGAAGYAAAAAGRLLEKHPEVADRFGKSAFSDWQAHLKQRLEELSAAVLADDPRLLVAEVEWSTKAFRAREVPDSDLRASLECLRDVLSEELPPAAGERPGDFLGLALAALDASNGGPPRQVVESDTDRLGLVYLEAALSGDRDRALEAVLSASEGALELPSVFEALMFAQRQTGEMWHARELGVAQEHFVTETTRAAITLLTERAETKESNGKTVVVALSPGNYHDMAARIVSAFFILEGWRVIHLAEQTPADELALGLEAFDADLLALSMSLSTQLSATIDLVARARAERPGLKVLLGGRVLVQSPQLCERIGADAWGESAADAPALGAQLVGLDSSTN